MIKPQFAIGFIAVLWVGMILAIGMESVVKFSTPSLSKIIAFDLGRVVFSAFNKLQLVLLLFMMAIAFFSRLTLWEKIGLIVITIIMIFQVWWLFPILSNRVDLLLSGIQPPTTYIHAFYSTLEIIKVLTLLFLGVQLLRYSN